MRIAFITPTLHSLGPNWHRDPQIVKLAAPTLSGCLRAFGHTEIRQYDFEVELFELEREAPGTLDLTVFFDDEAVDRFIAGEPSPVAAQVGLILERLEVEEADLFAFSCASVLEIYADMHAAGNINLCLASELARRFPGCSSVVGGLQMSPDSLHEAKYREMHERCPALGFSVQGAGEHAMLAIVDHLEGRRELRLDPPHVQALGQGLYLRNAHRGRVPAVVQITEKRTPRIVVADEAPAGDHERSPLSSTAIEYTPYFDPKNIERRKLTGAEMLQRYHLEDRLGDQLAPHLDDRVAILPLIFMEGCNARCAFCAYSMTTLVKRDLDRVIDSIRWMVETYGVRYFHFLNTNINGHMKYAEAFCDAIIDSGLDILWSDCANLWALNEPLIDKMVASGCIRLTFGLECPSPRMLKYIHKGVKVEQAHARLKYAHDKGIWNHLLLITGLPTETEADTAHFEGFLERSKDYVHGYSVSSFYLISSSLMGAFPEQYGLEMRPNESGLLEHQGFDEVGGLTWEEKQAQIVDSTRRIQKAIARLKQDPKYSSGAIDLELVFWLYDRLGHDNKDQIVAAYEAAWLGTPTHVRHYEATLRRGLGAPPPELAGPLARLGVTPRPDEIGERGGVLSLPLGDTGSGLALQFRLTEAGGPEALTCQLHADALEGALRRLCGDGGKLRRLVTGKGFELEHGAEPGRLRLRRGASVLDLEIALAVDGRPALVKHGPLYLRFGVPPGHPDPSPTLIRFMSALGGALLRELAEALTDSGLDHLDRPAAGALADALVGVLEASYADELRPAYRIEAERHGNKFSRVPA